MTKIPNGHILIATSNPGKITELGRMLNSAGLEFSSLADFAGTPDVEETGSTFSQNAILKATSYAAAAGITALADDSGLEVEALGWSPGALSARFGGPETGYSEKIDKLLKEIERAPGRGRAARFVCVMAIAAPSGEVLAVEEGVCPGRIANAPAGNSGFGYDPVFIPEGFERTFGELESEIKDLISHRAIACSKIMRYLLGFTAV